MKRLNFVEPVLPRLAPSLSEMLILFRLPKLEVLGLLSESESSLSESAEGSGWLGEVGGISGEFLALEDLPGISLCAKAMTLSRLRVRSPSFGI